jgi:hypothetical protein
MQYPLTIGRPQGAGSLVFKIFQPFAGRACHNAAANLNRNRSRIGQPLAELTKIP